jgi:hypothetical protein
MTKVMAVVTAVRLEIQKPNRSGGVNILASGDAHRRPVKLRRLAAHEKFELLRGEASPLAQRAQDCGSSCDT